jgi:heme oxygenase
MPFAAGPALLRLREDTAALHQEAERHVRILDADATDAVYARYLARLYGFHAPMEDVFARDRSLAAAGFDAAGRRKRGLLADDLAALGVRADRLPLCSALPAFAAPGAIVGAAYVIEGSTLGGAFVLARMRGALAHLIGRATSFLAGYGADTGPRWKAFAALAERLLADDDARAAAAAGARATFASLIEWLDERAAEPPHPHRGLARRRVEALG